jgi:hypothetical protein
MVSITLDIPEDLFERAKTQGLITNERIVQLLEAEMGRLEVWQRIEQNFALAGQSFRAEYGVLSDDEVMQMLTDVVHEIRQEIRSENGE